MESVDGLKIKWFFATVLTIFFVAFVATQVLEVGAATTRNFTLYASYVQGGWGFTPGNITSPGPMIVVEQGDTVNLTLTSLDGYRHKFFVSYTNSTTLGASDPQSLDFTGTTNYSFNATNTIGTYEYFCYYHYNTLWGYFRVVSTGTIPEFQPLAMLSLLIVGVGIATLARKRKRQI
jgi:heme/copper-type cytochrome/quinol oxidase subunit 2